MTTRRHAYFHVIVGLAWSHDPENYAGDSVTTGRVSHARQVKANEPNKRGYPDPPGGAVETLHRQTP
jgi:hypothetical protein